VASEKPFNCHSTLWLPLSFVAPNPKHDSSEDSEVNNWLEKILFVYLVKDAKSIADFFLSSTA